MKRMKPNLSVVFSSLRKQNIQRSAGPFEALFLSRLGYFCTVSLLYLSHIMYKCVMKIILKLMNKMLFIYRWLLAKPF